jgi:spore coat polysaccharide biosynthesis protein SpsF
MKFLAAIQARCGSSRLPGKILMDLAGKPVLQRVIERVEKSSFIDEVIVVTSISEKDIPTVNLVSGLGRRVFAGSEDDVLDRYYQAARLIQPEYVVRITADCPVFDSKILDMAIRRLEPGSDYLSDMGETLADGLDLEIVRFSALKKAWQKAQLASEREHVTLYIKNHPEEFALQQFESPYPHISNYRWTLDEIEDYQLIGKIYEHFGEKDFDTADILDFFKNNPGYLAINSKYARNEGLAKSLANDYIINGDD